MRAIQARAPAVGRHIRLAVTQAVYALERDDETWLTGSLSSLSKLLGSDYNYFGFFYDAGRHQTRGAERKLRSFQTTPQSSNPQNLPISRSLCE